MATTVRSAPKTQKKKYQLDFNWVKLAASNHCVQETGTAYNWAYSVQNAKWLLYGRYFKQYGQNVIIDFTGVVEVT